MCAHQHPPACLQHLSPSLCATGRTFLVPCYHLQRFDRCARPRAADVGGGGVQPAPGTLVAAAPPPPCPCWIPKGLPGGQPALVHTPLGPCHTVARERVGCLLGNQARRGSSPGTLSPSRCRGAPPSPSSPFFCLLRQPCVRACALVDIQRPGRPGRRASRTTTGARTATSGL
jgi:hypothetical protein